MGMIRWLFGRKKEQKSVAIKAEVSAQKERDAKPIGAHEFDQRGVCIRCGLDESQIRKYLGPSSSCPLSPERVALLNAFSSPDPEKFGQTRSSAEAVFLLMDRAFSAAPEITETEVTQEHKGLRATWDSKELFKGSHSWVRELVFRNLKEYERDNHFEYFSIDVYPGQKCAQVSAIFRDFFVGVRIWRTSGAVFICGNADFRPPPAGYTATKALKENTSAQSSHDICRAARDGNELVVMELLGKGANINATGDEPLDFSPLMWASNEGNMSLLRLLLNKRADPNLRNRRGASALLLAAITGHLDAVRLLLDKGADLHFETQGVSALSAAAAEGHLEVVRLLLERGARDDTGRAFEGASQIGHIEIMALLNPTRLLTGDYGSKS